MALIRAMLPYSVQQFDSVRSALVAHDDFENRTRMVSYLYRAECGLAQGA